MITAFKEIRLTNSNVSASGGALKVGNETVVYASSTGNFISNSNLAGLANSGNLSSYYLNSNPSGFIGSAQTGTFANITNLASTGSVLDGKINTLSGYINSTFFSGAANTQNFVTGLLSGTDSYFIRFPNNFTSIPKVQATLEVFSPVLYNFNIQTRSISGFFCLTSDVISETGVSLSVFSTIN